MQEHVEEQNHLPHCQEAKKEKARISQSPSNARLHDFSLGPNLFKVPALPSSAILGTSLSYFELH
jgi:hypothetical protein